MRDRSQLNPLFGSSLEEVKAYVQEAIFLGLTPIFDLVLRHVSIDNPLVSGEHPKFTDKIDTSRWFQRHPNDNLVIHNLDEN